MGFEFMCERCDVASPPSGQGVIESGAVISVHEVARCLTNRSTAAPPIPRSGGSCPGVGRC